jgi:large subunit ribosomal protein L30
MASKQSNKAENKAREKKLQVTYTTSSIGVEADQKQTVQRLGLRRLGQTVVKPDNAAVRGMLHKVRHLVTVVEVEG